MASIVAIATAKDIMDNACLPETLVANGVDRSLREAIAEALDKHAADAVAFEQRIPHGDARGAEAGVPNHRVNGDA